MNMDLMFYIPRNIREKGGGQGWILDVAHRLSMLNYNVTIASTYLKLDREDIIWEPMGKSVEIVELPHMKPPFGLLLRKRSLMRLLDMVKKVDVVYFLYSYIFQDTTLALMKELTGRPIISGFHLSPDQTGLWGCYIKTFGKEILKYFSAHHVVNHFAKDIFESWGLRNVYLIPNGVDTQKFKPLNPDDKDDAEFRVLFIGRLTKHKGVDVLYETISTLNEETEHTKLKFIIVGEGPLTHLVKSLSMKFNNVESLGYVAPKNIPRLYSEAHLVVLPSRREGMPLVALEAQSSGLPVVGSDIAGLKAIIQDQITGSLVSPGMPMILGSQVKHFYEMWSNNREEYLRICSKARENALNFDWNMIIKYLDRMFYEVYRKGYQ